MMMVVHGRDINHHRDLMEQVFRIRYQNFVVRRNWSLPTRDGMDIDQYDNEEAIYLIVFGEDHQILATARLTQTLKASLLADLFPSLIETGEAPRGAALWEGTRFTLSPCLKSKAAIRRARAELGCTAAALVEERGGNQIQAVVDFNAFPAFLEMSGRIRPLGLPRQYGGGVRASGGGRCIAFKWDLGPDLVSDFEAYGRGEIAGASEALSETIH